MRFRNDTIATALICTRSVGYVLSGSSTTFQCVKNNSTPTDKMYGEDFGSSAQGVAFTSLHLGLVYEYLDIVLKACKQLVSVAKIKLYAAWYTGSDPERCLHQTQLPICTRGCLPRRGGWGF